MGVDGSFWSGFVCGAVFLAMALVATWQWASRVGIVAIEEDDGT